MSQLVFPDNTVLCNFASVGRLDLLRDWLRGRGRWTDAVAHEARCSAHHLPSFLTVEAEGWLGEPIEITDVEAVGKVEVKRRVVFGGLLREPRKHLGEAQTCYLLSEVPEFRGSWWVTDDADAYDHASNLGIRAYRTTDIMRHIVADGDLTAQQAFDIMQAMAAHDRWLEMPSSPADLV